MTTRRFTKGVKEAVASRTPRTVDTFDRLERGDVVHLTGARGPYRFVSATLTPEGVVDHVSCMGPLGQRQRMRAIAPDRLKVPSQRVLDRQRATRASDA